MVTTLREGTKGGHRRGRSHSAQGAKDVSPADQTASVAGQVIAEGGLDAGPADRATEQAIG